MKQSDSRDYTFQDGAGHWRASARYSGKYSPWLSSRVAAKCWYIVQEDRVRPLVEAGYKITRVTTR